LRNITQCRDFAAAIASRTRIRRIAHDDFFVDGLGITAIMSRLSSRRTQNLVDDLAMYRILSSVMIRTRSGPRADPVSALAQACVAPILAQLFDITASRSQADC
jgi:hypothetical protein